MRSSGAPRWRSSRAGCPCAARRPSSWPRMRSRALRPPAATPAGAARVHARQRCPTAISWPACRLTCSRMLSVSGGRARSGHECHASRRGRPSSCARPLPSLRAPAAGRPPAPGTSGRRQKAIACLFGTAAEGGGQRLPPAQLRTHVDGELDRPRDDGRSTEVCSTSVGASASARLVSLTAARAAGRGVGGPGWQRHRHARGVRDGSLSIALRARKTERYDSEDEGASGPRNCQPFTSGT